jgi:hypothetical protein
MTASTAAFATTALRGIAVAIAIAALIDPVVETSGRGRPRLAVVALQASLAAERVRAQLVNALGDTHEIVPHITSDAAAAIVIGDRYPDEPVPAHLLVATVTTADPAPRARLVRLEAPREIPAGTAIRVDADIEVLDAGTATDLTVSIDGLEVVRLSHRFTSEHERWHAAMDVVPVGAPPWVVRAAVAPSGEPGSEGSSVAHAVVALRRDPLAVQVFELRPSWATAFVRRALESDPRFRVESVSIASRGVEARTAGSVALADVRLDTFDTVVVGGLEQLSAADVRALDRFMRDRGGAVVLVPDARVDSTPARGLMSLQVTERLLERPEKLTTKLGAAALDASELLLLRAPAPGVDGDVVATAVDGSPVILSLPRGRGRLFVSGALDAWRYRASDDRAFDRFWRGAIAALALAAAPPIEVAIAPPMLRPLERGEVFVQLRADAGAALTASVDGEPIRLWPEPEAGAYRGVFTAPKSPGRMPLEVKVTGNRPHGVARDLVVQERVDALAGSGAPLSLIASSHRGIDVTPERLDELERFVRATVTAPDVAGVRRPMRSTWWLLPFCASLCAEWCVRRRLGRR